MKNEPTQPWLSKDLERLMDRHRDAATDRSGSYLGSERTIDINYKIADCDAFGSPGHHQRWVDDQLVAWDPGLCSDPHLQVCRSSRLDRQFLMGLSASPDEVASHQFKVSDYEGDVIGSTGAVRKDLDG